MKKIIIVLFCLFFITGCKFEKTYEINSDEVKVCGEKIYISNFEKKLW